MPKMSERQLKALQDFPTSKLNTRVRFPSPAPMIRLPPSGKKKIVDMVTLRINDRFSWGAARLN